MSLFTQTNTLRPSALLGHLDHPTMSRTTKGKIQTSNQEFLVYISDIIDKTSEIIVRTIDLKNQQSWEGRDLIRGKAFLAILVQSKDGVILKLFSKMKDKITTEVSSMTNLSILVESEKQKAVHLCKPKSIEGLNSDEYTEYLSDYDVFVASAIKMAELNKKPVEAPTPSRSWLSARPAQKK